MQKRCCIIGAGPLECALSLSEYDFIIAADGGYAYLSDRNITPDLIVGDFDSLGYVPTIGNVIKHPSIKNDTDMMLAVKQGLEMGFTDFDIYGGIGGRVDHTLANIQTLLYLAEHHVTAQLLSKHEKMTVLKNSTVTFPASESGTLSVFAIGGIAEGVTETGLLYSLDKATLTPSFPLGISNEFTGKEATITVESGTLLLYRLQ